MRGNLKYHGEERTAMTKQHARNMGPAGIGYNKYLSKRHVLRTFSVSRSTQCTWPTLTHTQRNSALKGQLRHTVNHYAFQITPTACNNAHDREPDVICNTGQIRQLFKFRHMGSTGQIRQFFKLRHMATKSSGYCNVALVL